MWFWRSFPLIEKEKAVVQRGVLDNDMSPQDRFDLRLVQLANAQQHYGWFPRSVC